MESAATCNADFSFTLSNRDFFLQNNIDRARDRLLTDFGCSRTNDFNAPDRARRQRVERKTGRRPFAVQQNLTTAIAQPAHTNIASNDGDAGQTFQYIGKLGAVIFDDPIFCHHDFGCRIITLRIIALVRGFDLNGLNFLYC